MGKTIKKLLVTGLVLAGAYALISNTWVGSHLRLWAKSTAARVQSSVSPEREVERLRMEVQALKSQDERLINKVAQQAVEADKLEEAVAAQRKDLARREASMKAMHTALALEGSLVSLHGEKFPRAEVEKQLRLDFEAFEKDEELLRAREAHLAEVKRGLEANKASLSNLRVQREKMLADLQRLETALAEERRAEAVRATAIDDSGHQKIQAEIEAVKDRVAAMTRAREIQGSLEGPIKAAEKRQEEALRIKARIEQRLGGKGSPDSE
jgi:hypothetical protein